ncbi:Putative ABC transporter permease protein [endosymbiont DhMRE of Dentiscutata heterogama]|uniref:hypothetical protein n=1 Tax=endosymbiont DhMRE of Dentiscutata heterogama TaxID=1609546 RepID=UPI000629DACF|nr:hypothetical protein [endosymbiont DhMRE of Dentiscutata heterogama]CFW92836.1 Putative ABC transporter permease protein [endosymbiont DhMRE of Dentiscutata heterogama]
MMKKSDKIKKKSKKLPVDNNSPDQGTYNVWHKYNDFIRRLYLERPLKRPTGKQLTLKYLSKLAIVFFGALFTTLTFYFLIDPNGLYNSGLNGLLQAVSKLIVGRSNIGWGSYYFIYYGLGFVTNLLFILILRALFKAKLEIISTSIFYVLSQIIWTQIFGAFKLREYVFNRFNPSSWQGLSANSQLSFTLPYYIVIAIVAAIIHTYGYSLIFRAQATPGGLEIFTSHFSSQKGKKKVSISTLMKIFGLGIIFLVTLINFAVIEDDSQMRKSLLQKEIEEQKEKFEENGLKITGRETDAILKSWEEDIKKAKRLEKNENPDLKKIFALREKNRSLTSLLKNKTGFQKLENYPQEIRYYLACPDEKKEKLQAERDKIERKINSVSGEKLVRKLRRKNDLENRIKELDKEKERSVVHKYLSYITNNERLWATMVYIFLSSFLISQIFPRDQIILLRLHSLTEENRNKGLKLLKKFSPVYYTVYHRKGLQEEVIHVISCHLSKWNYYLLAPYLKQIGKPYSSEANASE